MKVTVEMNGIVLEKEIPIKWKEVTFKQFLELSKCENDTVKILGVFLGIDEKTLRKAKVRNLESILNLLNFLKTEMDLTLPGTCLGYNIPKNLELETIGQFEDLKLEAQSLTDFSKYTLFCAIYSTKPYDYKKAEELAPIFLNAPCEEVMAIGNFTLLKLAGLMSGIDPKLQNLNTPLRRWRLALKNYLTSLVFIARFYIWKKKLRLPERNS